MSVFLDTADAMKARLEATPALAGCIVVTDREDSIESKLLQLTQKGTPALIVIGWVNAENAAGVMTPPRFRADYAVVVNTKALLREPDATPAAAIVEAVATALHGWNPDPDGTCYEDLNVSAVSPDDRIPNVVTHRITVQAIIQMPDL